MAARKKGARKKGYGLMNRNQAKQLEQLEGKAPKKKAARKSNVVIWPK